MTESELLTITQNVLQALQEIGVKHRIVGSVASSKLGMMRATFDVDIVAALEQHNLKDLKTKLGQEFYSDEELMVEAVQNRSSFNLIHKDSMLKIDIFIQKNREYDRVALKRAFIDDSNYMTAEDVILGKLEWYRAGFEISERQWSDILGLMRVQANNLDLTYLNHWAAELSVTDLLQRAFHDSLAS
jgi:predicted DNA-binding protein (UPF0278 family)